MAPSVLRGARTLPIAFGMALALAACGAAGLSGLPSAPTSGGALPSIPATSDQAPTSATPSGDGAPGLLPANLVGSASVDYQSGDPGIAVPAYCPEAPLCDFTVTLRAVDVVWQFDHTNAPANPDVGVYRVVSGSLQWSVSGYGETPDHVSCEFSGSGTESLIVDEPQESGSLALVPVAEENIPVSYFGEAMIAIHGHIAGCGGLLDDPNLTMLCSDMNSPNQGPATQVPGSCGHWFDGRGSPVQSGGVWVLEELYPVELPGIHSSWKFMGSG